MVVTENKPPKDISTLVFHVQIRKMMQHHCSVEINRIFFLGINVDLSTAQFSFTNLFFFSLV